jgi:hypothetical protein
LSLIARRRRNACAARRLLVFVLFDLSFYLGTC